MRARSMQGCGLPDRGLGAHLGLGAHQPVTALPSALFGRIGVLQVSGTTGRQGTARYRL